MDTGISFMNSLWYVPITWTRGGAVDFDDLKPSEILSVTTTIIDRGTKGREWVIFNKQQSGYYRINYDSVTWSLITQALRNSTTREQIHEYNRAQIVDDVFIMARAGVISYNSAFDILSFLEFEDQYAPWIAAITGFDYVRRRLAHDPENLARLQTLIIRLSDAITKRLGFAEIEGEPYMDGLLRMFVNSFLCDVGHQECITAGRTAFANWRTSGTFIPANMRPWVYCTGLRYGGAEDFVYFWNRYLVENLANEQVVMIEAAGCTTDETSLQTYLNAITAGYDDYTIRVQDYTTAINSAITRNEVNTMRAFEWLRSNIQRTNEALGSIVAALSSITDRLLTEEQINVVSAWLETNQEAIGNASYNTGISGLAKARSNIQWYNQRISEFARYFETGYIVETFENVETTTPTPTEESITTEVTTSTTPSSAAVATLSFITFLFILSPHLHKI